MTKPLKLTDTQFMLLSAASQRDDLLLTCPEHLKGGAATAVLSKLLAVGLVNEVALGPDTPRWRVSDEGQAIGFRITRAGLDAIGIEPEGEGEQTADTGELHRRPTSDPAIEDAQDRSEGQSRAPRTGTTAAGKASW